jgi:hypothetical protein
MPSDLTYILNKFRKFGATRFFAKELAPNDNSKNQIYLAGDFSVLNVLPHSQIVEDTSTTVSSIRDRSKAQLDFYWLKDSNIYKAQHTKLILYPKYPEVRLSGFLLGCENAPRDLAVKRERGRTLLLATAPDRRILAKIYEANSTEAGIIRSEVSLGIKIGSISEISDCNNDAETTLLIELKRIHNEGWHRAVKLSNGSLQSYEAQNAGGYTLEALLGIEANSRVEPDFLGWEVKQYSVTDFINFRAKSQVTLMTPEPDGGRYKTDGVRAFVETYGYADKLGRKNRTNFGGVYNTKKEFHPDTGLKLVLDGYDAAKMRVKNPNGCLALIDRNDRLAASWSFSAILRHWTYKHSKAVFVASQKRGPPLEFAFGGKLELCQQTDALLFLRALSEGTVNYDPAIKIISSDNDTVSIKRRNQFRTAHKNIKQMYHSTDEKFVR